MNPTDVPVLWVNTILESPDNGLYPFLFVWISPHLQSIDYQEYGLSFGESEERLWRWTTDQCSEVSSSSLARSVVKCDITAQYSTVQHSTAQYSTVQRTRAGEQTEWGGRPSAEAVFTSSHHSTLCTHKQLFFVTPTMVLTFLTNSVWWYADWTMTP